MPEDKATGAVPFEVKIDAEQVNQAIVQAVLDSQIGEKVRGAVLKALEEKGYGTTTLIDDVIFAELKQITATAIHEQHAETLKRLVKERITEKKVEELLDRIWKKVMDY